MKVNNKTIIITDPCYFADDDLWGNGFDYTDCSIFCDEITKYLWEPTGFGDGSFDIHEMVGNVSDENELTDFIEDIEEADYKFFEDSTEENLKELDKLKIQTRIIGRFGVDSGTFGVFMLDEVLKICPNFLSKYKKLNGKLYTIIENYTGDLGFYTDEQDHKHIIGVGNISFYSNLIDY